MGKSYTQQILAASPSGQKSLQKLEHFWGEGFSREKIEADFDKMLKSAFFFEEHLLNALPQAIETLQLHFPNKIGQAWSAFVAIAVAGGEYATPETIQKIGPLLDSFKKHFPETYAKKWDALGKEIDFNGISEFDALELLQAVPPMLDTLGKASSINLEEIWPGLLKIAGAGELPAFKTLLHFLQKNFPDTWKATCQTDLKKIAASPILPSYNPGWIILAGPTPPPPYSELSLLPPQKTAEAWTSFVETFLRPPSTSKEESLQPLIDAQRSPRLLDQPDSKTPKPQRDQSA